MCPRAAGITGCENDKTIKPSHGNKMKKEHLLMIGSVAITLLIALGLLRWLAPGLLGVPIDLQTVQLSREVPPFYSNVLEKKSDDAFINDPIVNLRAPTFIADTNPLGPTDMLGFRNRNIPNSAQVITIGDSQTFGNNAALAETWPSVLEKNLGADVRVYNMATGGWGALQYLEMARHAHRFGPKVLVVAFYSGNDPLESFMIAYGNAQWAAFRLDKNLSARDTPAVAPPESQSD